MDLQRIMQCSGWRRRGLASLLGLCAAAALPPLYILPLLIPAFAGLVLLVHAAPTRKQAFWDGWWWGLGHFTAELYWICISLYVEPEKFAWLTPFALFGVPSVLAIYTGCVTALLHCCRVRPYHKVILFAALWVIAEYMRGHLFTGFPWSLTGYVWSISDVTLQPASVVGVYGVGWLAVIVATMPVLFVLKDNACRGNALSVGLLALCIVFGVWRLDTHPTRYTDVKLRIVQGNIPEYAKWDPKTTFLGLKTYASLTHSPGIGAITIVVWPETAVPYYVTPHSELTHDLGSMLPPSALLITGAMRENGDRAHWQAWNSLFVIASDGSIVAQYDKHHLVPFGEYIPLRHVLPLDAIAGGHGDFSTGPGPETLFIPPYPPFSPLICYEAIFPEESTDHTGRAGWLVNITNDAWFGMSAGPYQHLQMARMRAVEQGLPLVRAANTGISAEFDAFGRMLGSLPLGKKGVLDVALAKPSHEKSIFSRYPLAWPLFMIVLSGVFIIFPSKKGTCV
jgi:apolipoprotein N-acyltransferase